MAETKSFEDILIEKMSSPSEGNVDVFLPKQEIEFDNIPFMSQVIGTIHRQTVAKKDITQEYLKQGTENFFTNFSSEIPAIKKSNIDEEEVKLSAVEIGLSLSDLPASLQNKINRFILMGAQLETANVSETRVKREFRKLAFVHHPDCAMEADRVNSALVFSQLKELYDSIITEFKKLDIEGNCTPAEAA